MLTQMFQDMVKRFSAAVVLSLFGVLPGCIIVPGSNINPAEFGVAEETNGWFENRSTNDGVWFPGLRRENADTKEDQEAAQQLVDIVAINPELVAAQQAQHSFNSIPAAIPAALQLELENYEYHVDKGDMLTITVYDHPELTNPSGSNNNNLESSGIIVENDGTIYYPYIGKVQIAGLTIDQVRETIATPLSEFIATPQVNVRVIRFNAKRVYVTGQVNRPGPLAITNVPLTVLDAIVGAGGLADNANWHDVLLSRNGVETRLSVYEMLNNGRLGQNMLLQHGDVLHVPVVGQRQIYVMGELNRVNTLPIGNISMSLTEALTRSGGLNQVTSNAAGIFVIRAQAIGTEKLATVYQLNVKNAISFAVGVQFMLQPSDIVYVTTAPVTRWNRVISQIIPSLNALITADRVSTL